MSDFVRDPSKPKTIFIGEVRGDETYEEAVLKWNTGHSGPLTTITGASVEKSLEKFLEGKKTGSALERMNEIRKQREQNIKDVRGRKSKRG